GRVQTDQLVLEAELLLAYGLGGDLLEQGVEHFLEQLPGAMRVGVRKRGAGRGRDPQVGQLAFTASQPAFDFPQRMGAAQLTEQHRDKLAPTGDTLRRVLGRRLFDESLKL